MVAFVGGPGPILIALLGVVMFTFGMYRRQRGTEPRCRACLFSLEGLTDPRRCPECGQDLLRRRAVRHGVPQRRPVVLVLGLALLLGGFGWMGVATRASLTSPRWFQQVPEWWLADVEARFASGQRLDEVIVGLNLLKASGSGRSESAVRGRDRIVRRIMESSPQAPLSTHLGFFAKSTLWAWADEWEPQPSEAVSFIRKLLWIRHSPQTDDFKLIAGVLQLEAMPRSWVVNYAWSALDHNGRPLGTIAVGRIRSGRPDQFGVISWGDPAVTPHSARWVIRISKETDLSVPPHTWSVDVPWPDGTEDPRFPPMPGR
jgi:hypothetical protein